MIRHDSYLLAGKDMTLPEPNTPAGSRGKREHHLGDPCVPGYISKKPKMTSQIREDKVNDKSLMKIGREIGDKWLEVGLALGVDFMDLMSRIGNNPNIPNQQKPLHMLHEWRTTAAELFTYEVLASALEEVGLNSCAQTHCYESR